MTVAKFSDLSLQVSPYKEDEKKYFEPPGELPDLHKQKYKTANFLRFSGSVFSI
jgi:hypothetical protein